MRWHNQAHPVHGQTRVRARFLLFPKRIGLEGRWLEFAVWVDKWHRGYMEPGHWHAERWVSD